MNTTQRSGETIESPQSGGQGARPVLLPTLLRASVPVLLITALAGFTVHEYSARQPEVYQATSQLVLSTSGNFTPVGASYGGGEDRYVQNQADIMLTQPVLELAAATLADGVPAPELRGSVTADPVLASDVINVTAEADDPELAARRADAVANAYAQFTAAQVTALADQAATASQADPAVVLDIRARAAAFGDGVSVIQPAPVPDAVTSPTPTRNAGIAAIAAFLLSAGLAISWRGWRRPVSPDQIAAEVGGPLFGEVPVRWYRPTGGARQPGANAYRIAVQALRYRIGRDADQSVLITGVGRSAGATSALLGLAAARASEGGRVVMVDATAGGRLLRRTGVSAPTTPLSALTRPEDLDEASAIVSALTGPHGGSVRVLRLDPGSMTSPEELRLSLRTLVSAADTVLVDAGVAVEDPAAFALLGEVGSVVAVVRANDRVGADRTEFRQRLALAGRDCDGVLLTRRTWLPSLRGRAAERAPVAPARSTPAAPAPRAPLEPTATAGRPRP